MSEAFLSFLVGRHFHGLGERKPPGPVQSATRKHNETAVKKWARTWRPFGRVPVTCWLPLLEEFLHRAPLREARLEAGGDRRDLRLFQELGEKVVSAPHRIEVLDHPHVGKGLRLRAHPIETVGSFVGLTSSVSHVRRLRHDHASSPRDGNPTSDVLMIHCENALAIPGPTDRELITAGKLYLGLIEK